MQNTLTRTTTLFESSLDQAERDADAAAGAVSRLLEAVKTARTAAKTGDLKALHKARDVVTEALGRANSAVVDLQDGWELTEAEEEAYLQSGEFTRELLDAARVAGVSLFEQESFLACYPSLIRMQPKDRALAIDRKLYRHLRPSHLAAHLAKIQKGSPKLNAAQFLETLHDASTVLSPKLAGLQRFVDLYRVLTLLPTVRKDYSLQEFARDVYLLDGSGLTATRAGVRFRLDPGATGAKNRTNLLIVVTREGLERTYLGIEFLR